MGSKTSKDTPGTGSQSTFNETSLPGYTSVKISYVNEHMEKLKVLENAVREKDTIISSNNNRINFMTINNGDLEKDKLNLTQLKDKLADKCDKLEKNNAYLKSELTKFDTMPVLKQILDLFEHLQNFRKEADETANDDTIDEDSKKLGMQITQKRIANLKMVTDLKQRSYELTNEYQKKQLMQAEVELITIQNNSYKFLNHKKQKLPDIMDKLKKSLCHFDSVSTSVQDVEKELQIYKEELSMLQNASNEIKTRQREKCEKILAILQEQSETLCGLLKLPHISKASSYDNLTEIDEDDSVFVTDECKKRYTVVLYNLQESGPNDRQKVIKIINFICGTSQNEIKIQRLGAFNNKSRPIKVYVPTFKCVSSILSNRFKLRNSCYTHIKIVPFNKEKPNASFNKETPNKTKSTEQEKSATFSFKSV